MSANSIIDALNESIQNFKNSRGRNKSGKPSPVPFYKESPIRKLNSFSSEQDKFSAPSPAEKISKTPLRYTPKNASNGLYSSKNKISDAFSKQIGQFSPVETKTKAVFEKFIHEEEKTANFTMENIDASQYNQEILDLFSEISLLKNDQKGLENQIIDLESKISKNLDEMHQSLTKSDFSSIITRIGGLQEKFSNRSKSNFSTEKLSDLFEKINNLEFEAERIKRENTEVEMLYHQSLNEIYQKIEKLKVENKTLTDMILSSSVNSSPKHAGKRDFLYKKNNESVEKLSMESSLKKIEAEEKNENYEIIEIMNEKQIIEEEITRIENELKEIPINSKSMANKKKKQMLENELFNNQSRLEALTDKLQGFS